MEKRNQKELLAPQVVPEIQNTRPEVFILESLSKQDEKHRRFEGRILSDMLHLCGKNPKYYYFQTAKELPHLVGLFRESQYRYLHISSHASATEIGTTEGSLTYERFARIFEGHLKRRRLFFSACEVGNSDFVNAVSGKNKGMYSVVAPAEAIQFDYAAAQIGDSLEYNVCHCRRRNCGSARWGSANQPRTITTRFGVDRV